MSSSPKGADVNNTNKFENLDALLEPEMVRPIPTFRRKRAESFSSSQEFEKKQIQKMKFIWNALDQGWTIKKKDNNFIFTKKHENKMEVFRDNYLENFLISNFTKEAEN